MSHIHTAQFTGQKMQHDAILNQFLHRQLDENNTPFVKSFFMLNVIVLNGFMANGVIYTIGLISVLLSMQNNVHILSNYVVV